MLVDLGRHDIHGPQRMKSDGGTNTALCKNSTNYILLTLWERKKYLESESRIKVKLVHMLSIIVYKRPTKS